MPGRWQLHSEKHLLQIMVMIVKYSICLFISDRIMRESCVKEFLPSKRWSALLDLMLLPQGTDFTIYFPSTDKFILKWMSAYTLSVLILCLMNCFNKIWKRLWQKQQKFFQFHWISIEIGAMIRAISFKSAQKEISKVLAIQKSLACCLRT